MLGIALVPVCIRLGFARRHAGQRTINMNTGEMVKTKEDRSTRKKKICSSATLKNLNSHGLTWVSTRASAVKGWQLTAYAMARP